MKLTKEALAYIKENILKGIAEDESCNDIERQIRIGNLNAVYDGRLTVKTCNLITRGFDPWRDKSKRLEINPADKTYLDWMRSVVAGKYDAMLLDLYGFGKVALRELKDTYAKELELTGAMDKIMTLDEMLALPPETSEQAYRRGYCDGYIVALQDVAGNRPVNAKLWNFWQNALTDWMRRAEGETKIELPPTPANPKD